MLYNHLAIWSEDSWGTGEGVSLAYIVGWGWVPLSHLGGEACVSVHMCVRRVRFSGDFTAH